MKNSNERTERKFGPSHGLKVLRIAGWVVVGLAFAVAFALIFGLVVKLLWNWLMPALFGLKEITFWQAFGIVLLAKILFSGFGPHHRDRYDHFPRKFPGRSHDFWGMREEKNWKYYRQFWHDEGKAAFEDYLRRIEEQKQEKKED